MAIRSMWMTAPIQRTPQASLTDTTLTGLGMNSVAEEQTIFIQAGGGTYMLRADGFGTETGLPNFTSIVAGKTIVISRQSGYALVTLGFDLDAADARNGDAEGFRFHQHQCGKGSRQQRLWVRNLRDHVGRHIGGTGHPLAGMGRDFEEQRSLPGSARIRA